ncbi:MAG: zinc ribbon domain-containing protein [Verrucomicrobiota bacterium]|nr:zinc ribbon domain-containing protein [Verrucomicrobiota bacterium]|tara:strand:- start:315 stop:524 length:210 start_codon:yes stop_codon:yes gene_type:complete
MPTYTYETIPQKKGERPRQFEVVQKMKDPPLKKHPDTGQPCKRIITGGCGVVFHGPSIMSMNVPSRRKK